MSKPGWIVRKAFVTECGNCGAWSIGEATPEAAENSEHMREVDGVAMCLPCADAIAAEEEGR